MKRLGRTKVCTKCGRELPTMFYKRGDSTQLRSHCKECISNKAKTRWYYDDEFRNKGKLRSKIHHLRTKYNLTIEEWEDLSKDGCFICGSTDRLCVDHSHSTGKIRGCLCHKCNAAIGLLGDSAEDIRRAYDYIVRFGD